MRVAADMSSIIWTCLNAGTDREGKKIEFEGRRVQVNSAEYGYENVVNHFLKALNAAKATPKDLIMVFEGMNSKAPRLLIDGKYKANRGNRPPEAYQEFSKLSDRLKGTFGALGACSVTQDEVEGDDILGYLAQNTESDLMIDSYDGDLAVLSGTNEYGATVYVYRGGEIDVNPFGEWSSKYITVYKALVGDSSDGIKGIPGFGVAAFDSFMEQFGEYGLSQLDRMAKIKSLDELAPDMDNKIVGKIVEGAVEFHKSYRLALIRPEWVNTLHNPLVFKPGLVKGVSGDERLAHWEGGQYLVTADKWERFKPWALELMAISPFIALDIETSTPDESDEWLVAQEDPEGVDVIGSELTGMSLTFGRNIEHTVYIPVDHKDTENVDSSALREFIEEVTKLGKELIIHNFSFEGTVLFNAWGQTWKQNGYEGMLPNCLDTKLEASYVDENNSLGLKKLAKRWFDYDQVEYAAVTTIDGVRYKMRELTGAHVKSYGCDDTIVTASFHNFAKLFLELEHTWKVYLDVEIDAMYLHTQSFIHGTRCDVAKSKELEAIDDATYAAAWATVAGYLVTKGWDGCVCPVYAGEPTPAQIKEAFAIVHGKPLETAVRKMDKLVEAAELQGTKLFAECMTDTGKLNELVAMHFKGEPTFNPGSPLQMQKLLYETMALPVRVYNKPTPAMKAKGIRQGSPKSDELAITYALAVDANEEQKSVLGALRLMKMVQTRRGLYYKTYPYFVHWKTGRIHSSHNQCATNTRRASSSKPNLQQLPKSSKVEGQAARFREVIVPHKRNAVIVSCDFSSQEILLLAEWSKDPALEKVFTGDPPMDMHSMTGVGIWNSQNPTEQLSYEAFKEAIDSQDNPLHKRVKGARKLAKTVNFGGQYRASAAKMATILMVTESDAQVMIEAKAEAFPVAEKWALNEMSSVKDTGIVKTMLGAIRHLGPAITSTDFGEASKAERQTLSYRIQGSAAEMTKLAECRMWQERLEQKYDCHILGSIHDEVIASVVIEELPEFIKKMHGCMVAQYANMRLPIRSSISFGKNLYEQIEIGDEPTDEAVAKGLEELAKLHELV